MSETRLFDRPLIATRKARARAIADIGAQYLLERAADDLTDRLATVLRPFPLALAMSHGGSALATRLAKVPSIGRCLSASLGELASEADVVIDEEWLPFAPASLDLIVSGLSLQFVNDLPGALIQARRALKPDGLFLAAVMGGDTLSELRAAFTAAEAELTGGVSPRVIPFADVRDLGGLLQRAGFALPVTDSDRVVARYPSPLHLMRDLRAMAATNVLSERLRRPTRRAVIARMLEIYHERFSDPDGKVRATFEIIHVSGWAPHDSQQKPLKPGSAKARLADALNTTEVRTGDPAGGPG